MIKIASGFFIGCMMTAITAGWAESVKDNPCMHDGSGCVTVVQPDNLPMGLFDQLGVVMAARSQQGKAVTIQADEDGYVICSPKSK
jgi:hypothetical protein